MTKNPFIIIEFGFFLEINPKALSGFDTESTLLSLFWFGQKLRTLDQALLQQIFPSTVAALQTKIPGLSEIGAFDVKF